MNIILFLVIVSALPVIVKVVFLFHILQETLWNWSFRYRFGVIFRLSLKR